MQLSPDSKDNAPSEAATNNDATDENIIDVVCLMPICNELQRCPLNPHNSLRSSHPSTRMPITMSPR